MKNNMHGDGKDTMVQLETNRIGRREFMKAAAQLAAGLALPGCMESPRHAMTEKGRKPNIVFLLVDDLGWTDLGCFGSTFYETPHIDRLAARGMRFTNAHAACCVCSPTRASIMTGKYPARLHLTDWIEGHKKPYAKLAVPDWTMYLPHAEVTIAEALKEGGYATAMVGKWHLGSEPYYPEHQGFDVNIGGGHIGQPGSYFYPYGKPGQEERAVPGLAHGGHSGEYLTDRLTEESMRFIDKNRDHPFFLYLSFYAVHTPLEPKADRRAYYDAKADPENPQRNPLYAAMIDSLDQNIGRLYDHLERLGLVENTILIFMSDNGGLIARRNKNYRQWGGVTSNLPLRSGKGDVYEGGVREPMFVIWPGVTRPGDVCHEPVITNDFYPTMLEMAQLPLRPQQHMDGVSLAPLLQKNGRIPSRSLYWHYPHYHPGGATPYSAILKDEWRLIEFLEDGRCELYNLREDIGETNNLAAEEEDKAAELLLELQQWRRRVGAQMPTPNPNYDPDKK